MTWRASVLTLFPEMFPGPLGISLLGKAQQKNIWSLDVRDIREHGLGKHRTVDDTPSGGGPGMVMRADVACAAIDATRATNPDAPAIYLSPRGKPLTQARVRELSAGPGAILLCHDIHAPTISAMPETLDTLLARGYHFVTVSQLLSMDSPVAAGPARAPGS